MGQSRNNNPQSPQRNQTSENATPEPTAPAITAEQNLQNNPAQQEPEPVKVEVKVDHKSDPRKSKGAATFTYVGAGADSPRLINFMGRQEFVRGEETEVTDPEVLAKLYGNPTFVQGAADQRTLHRIDEEGARAEKAQRQEDRRTQSAFDRTQRKLAGHGED